MLSVSTDDSDKLNGQTYLTTFSQIIPSVFLRRLHSIRVNATIFKSRFNVGRRCIFGRTIAKSLRSIDSVVRLKIRQCERITKEGTVDDKHIAFCNFETRSIYRSSSYELFSFSMKISTKNYDLLVLNILT